MANNLSFGVAINLLTEKFNQGKQEIKNGFNDIKSSAMQMAGVLGAGLGLSELASKMLDVAKESESVQRALKVASGSAAEYGDNQKYLMETADKLGLKLNDITGQFAKFSAAGKTSNISLKDQQAAFTGLNAAMMANGTTGDKKASVFSGLDKMMEKNTITTKMLSSSFGEMPEMLTLAAQSMGVTVDQLREMSKHGELLASDLIPRLGKTLNETFKNVDSDTIEGALNRVGNSFEELTAKLGTGNIYKSLVNGFGEAFKWIVDNFKTVGDAIVNIVSTVIIAKAFGAIKAGYIEIQTAAETSFINQAIQAEKAAVIEELAGTNLTKKSQKRYLDESLAASKSYAEQEFATQKFALTSQLAFQKVGLAIKSAFAAFLPMLIISGIIAIGQYLYDLYERQQALNKITSDYQNGLKNAGNNDSGVKDLNRLKDIVNDTNKTLIERQTALNQINTILKTNYQIEKDGKTINGDINQSIKDRIALLTKAAEISYLVNKKGDTESKLDENLNKQNEEVKIIKDNSKSPDPVSMGLRMYHENELSKLKEERNPLKQNYSDINKRLDKVGYVSNSETSNLNDDDELTGKKVKKTDVENIEDGVQKSLIEYKNQLDNKNISTKEYNDKIDKLNKDTYDKLSGVLTPEQAAKDQVYKDSKAGTLNPLTSTDDKLIDIKDKYTKELNDSVITAKYTNQSTDDLKKAQISLIDSTVKQIISLGKITPAIDAELKKLAGDKTSLQNKTFVMPTAPNIDHTFDYKKDDVEKQTDLVKQNDDYIKLLSNMKKEFNVTSGELINLLDDAMKKAPDLQKALKLMEVKKDVKDLQTQLSTGLYSGVKEVANSAKNLYESFKAVKDTFSNVNATGFEKILSVWDSMTNTIDSIMSIVKMIQSLETITKSLGAAKTVLTTIDTATTATQITNIGALAAAKVAAAAIEVPAAVAITTASSAEMAAESAASYAAIPFVGEGLALAQIGVLNAAIMASGIPKFADGGVVGGSSYTGDKIIAGLNSGEVVLNQNQQNKLLNNQNSGGGQVTFVLKGKDLVGTINNYNNIKSKV